MNQRITAAQRISARASRKTRPHCCAEPAYQRISAEPCLDTGCHHSPQIIHIYFWFNLIPIVHSGCGRSIGRFTHHHSYIWFSNRRLRMLCLPGCWLTVLKSYRRCLAKLCCCCSSLNPHRQLLEEAPHGVPCIFELAVWWSWCDSYLWFIPKIGKRGDWGCQNWSKTATAERFSRARGPMTESHVQESGFWWEGRVGLSWFVSTASVAGWADNRYNFQAPCP